MTVKTFDAEGCTTGVALTTGNQGASGDVVTPVAVGTGSVQATATSPIRGVKSLVLSASASGDAAYVKWSDSGSASAAGQRAEFAIPSAPPNDITLMSFQGSGGAAASIVLRSTGRIALTNASAGTTVFVTPNDSTGILTFPVTVTIDSTVDLGASTSLGKAKLDIYKNAVSLSTPWYSMTELTGQNFYRTGVVIEERVGINTATAGAWSGLKVDSWKTADSYGLLGTFSTPVNLPPTFSPPARQLIAASTSASLVAVASDPEGATPTHLWTNSTRPSGASAPTLTNTTSATLATTGTLTTPGTYTFNDAISDGTNTVNATAIVDVYAADGSCQGKSLDTNPFTGTVAFLNNTSAADYLESTVAPAGDVVIERMNPIKPGDIVHTAGGYRQPNPGTGCELKVDILAGASDTQVATRTFTMTVTDADYPVALTGGENSAFAGITNSYAIWAVRYTATQV